MKRLIVITALILLAGFTFGQKLQKGNLVGMHVLTIDLEDITMNQFLDFYSSQLIPKLEKNAPGWKAHLVKGIRGENENSFGLIWVIESDEVRNKYYNEDGSPTELGISIQENVQPIVDELNKLGTMTSEYTDWLVL
jgi:hypothetical protein